MNLTPSQAIIVLVIGFIGFIGWCLNIFTIATADGLSLAMLVLRVVGIFVAPLGSVLGFIPS
jgi:hypothetical protein